MNIIKEGARAKNQKADIDVVVVLLRHRIV